MTEQPAAVPRGDGASTSRQTPYELAFAPPDYEARVFPDIREEIEGRAIATIDPDRFLGLETVGRTLREMEAVEGMPEPPSIPPMEAREHARLLFHAYRFWIADRPVWQLSEGVTQELLTASAPIGTWAFTAPAPAGYLQLPRHRVWARTSPEAPAESVDGFLWAITPLDAAAGERIDVVLALGMHPDRPGFSAVDATAWLPAPPPGHWGDIDAREDGADFASVLPGGELRGLYSLTSLAELMKLASRAFHRMGEASDSIGEPIAPGGTGARNANEMPPSRLPGLLVTTKRER